MDTDIPHIPGWRPVPGHELPHGPILAWFPDKDWDGDPLYYQADPTGAVGVPGRFRAVETSPESQTRGLALQFANDASTHLDAPEEIVARAEAYYRFLSGLPRT